MLINNADLNLQGKLFYSFTDSCDKLGSTFKKLLP